MPRLQALRSPLQSMPNRLTAPVTTRLRGRAAVERRARWLTAHPLCVKCEEQGRVTAAVTPDHVVPLWKGGADTDANLQSLCRAHHDEKSRAEAAERAQTTARG